MIWYKNDRDVEVECYLDLRMIDTGIFWDDIVACQNKGLRERKRQILFTDIGQLYQ